MGSRKAEVTLRLHFGEDWEEAVLTKRHRCGSLIATYNFSRGTNCVQTLICNGCGEDLV
jgi:hypothetical protein